jgi:hypothetical protein
MKHFKEYLAENERVYNYRIKIAGDTPRDVIKALEEKLQQFDVVSITAPKTTPVMARLADFPAIENESCTHMDVEFRYPAIEPQIRQIAQLLGIDPNRVCMLTVPYENNYDKEAVDVEKQNKDLLTNTDYPAPNAEQKALYKDYSAAPEDHAVLKNTYRSEFTVAGGKTPPAVTTNSLPMGDKSPMTKIKRPPRPATGYNPKG